MFLSKITSNRERRVNKLSLLNSDMLEHFVQSDSWLNTSFFKIKIHLSCSRRASSVKSTCVNWMAILWS